MIESSSGPAAVAAALDRLRDAVAQAARVGVPPAEIQAMVAAHTVPPAAGAELRRPAPALPPDAPDRPHIYTELPDGLIPLGDASRKYGCPMYRMRNWLAQGQLHEAGRLKASARGGGYTLVSEAELQECLKVRRKPGRPRKVA